jgi:hypothetical protein
MIPNTRALQDRAEKIDAEARARANGQATQGLTLSYSPEFSRTLANAATVTTFQNALQGTDGSLKMAPDPLGTGTLIPGRYGIDESGRFVAY